MKEIELLNGQINRYNAILENLKNEIKIVNYISTIL